MSKTTGVVAPMLNMDFTQPITLDTAAMPWQPSPRAGVWRKPLARAEAERGHATSIVRYDAGARFHAHPHPAGEEILVLDGTFSDETGDFPAGTYLRNPPGFTHAPFSHDGCVLLVKLHQFQPDDLVRVAIDTRVGTWFSPATGASVQWLHRHGEESVVLVKLTAGAPGIAHAHPGGEEIYVLDGEIADEDATYGTGTWLRRPPGSHHCPYAQRDALLWVKAGHLLAVGDQTSG